MSCFLYLYKCQFQTINENLCTVECTFFVNKKVTQIGVAFWKVSGFLYIYINISHFFLLFVNIKTFTVSFSDRSRCYFHLHVKRLFCAKFLYTKNGKNEPLLLKEFFYPKYRELSSVIKMEFCIFEIANNSIAIKL